MAWTSVWADGLVLESYVGERPDDADAIVASVFKELASRDYVVGERAVTAIGERLAGSGSDPSKAALTALTARVERAEVSYFKGMFQEAAAGAEASWQSLVGWSGYLCRNQDRRVLLRRALIVFAESQRQLGASEQATRAMAELVRSFPSQPLTTAEQSPQLVRVFRKIARDLEKQGRGTLSVTVDDPSAAVFINEEYTGAGTVEKQLLPGRYRVYVQQGDERPGRVHEIEVNAGDRQQLSIVWALDSSLRTRGHFAGFAFVDEPGRRAQQAANAVRVARALNVDTVIVVGIRTYGERRALIGEVISLDTGTTQKSAHLSLEPVVPSADRVRELARFLAGDKSAGPFEPVVEKPLTDGSVLAPRGPPFGLLKWTALTLGVAALATGGTLVAIHRDMPPDMQVPYTRNSRPAGLFTLAAGALLTGVGVYFFIRDKGSSGARARTPEKNALVPVLTPVDDGLAIGLSGRF